MSSNVIYYQTQEVYVTLYDQVQAQLSIDVTATVSLVDTVTATGTLTRETDASVSLTDIVAYNVTYYQPPPTPTPQPRFTIVNYPSSLTTIVYTPTTLTVTVKEGNNVAGGVRVALLDDMNKLVTYVDAVFNPGEQRDVNITFTAPGTPGTYTWSIQLINQATGVLDDAKTFTLNVTAGGGQPKFVISIPASITAKPGEQFKLQVTVQEVHAVSGTCILYVYDHLNNKVATEYVNILTPGGSQYITITLTAPGNEGSYIWRVDAYNFTTEQIDDSKTFTLNVTTQPPPTPTPTPTPTTTTGKSTALALLLILGAVALAVVGQEKR